MLTERVLAAVLLTVLAAAPPGPPKVLVLDLRALDIEPSTASVINGVVASAVASHKELQVTSAEDVRQMLDLAAQKQATGCDDQACLSEVAGAIGARYVMHGSLGKLGGSVVVTLAIFDAQSALALGKKTVQAASMEQLPAELRPAVDELVGDLTGVHASASSSPASHKDTSGGGSSLMVPAGIGLASLGGIAVVVGGILAAVEGSAVYDVDHHTPDEREQALGGTWLSLGVVGAGVLAAAAGGAVIYAGSNP